VWAGIYCDQSVFAGGYYLAFVIAVLRGVYVADIHEAEFGWLKLDGDGLSAVRIAVGAIKVTIDRHD
jgi:hypothetical protein